MEAFGKVHPSHRSYHQWDQMQAAERQLHRIDMAELFIATNTTPSSCIPTRVTRKKPDGLLT